MSFLCGVWDPPDGVKLTDTVQCDACLVWVHMIQDGQQFQTNLILDTKILDPFFSRNSPPLRILPGAENKGDAN